MPVTALSSSSDHSSSIELAHGIHREAQAARAHLFQAYDHDPFKHTAALRLLKRIEFATDRAIESEATVLLIKSARSHERLLTSAILLEARVQEARSYLSGFEKHVSR